MTARRCRPSSTSGTLTKRRQGFDPTLDEYFEALAVIVQLAREMIRLDRVDREFDAAERALGIGVGHAQPR
jgi:hypothetical protein